MRYGNILRTTEVNVIDHKEIPLPTRYRQSIFLDAPDKAADVFDALLNEMQAKGLAHGALEVELYPDTGKIKRVVKSWTEVR